MEIIIKGQGELVICLIDRTGETLIQNKVTISGSPNIEAKTDIPLVVDTSAGEVLVAPVLVHRSNRDQQITFEECEPSSFTKRRCKEIGCDSRIIKKIDAGKVKLFDKDIFILSGIVNIESGNKG